MVMAVTGSPGGGGRRYSGMDAQQRVDARRATFMAAALQQIGTVGYTGTTVKQICLTAALTERYFYESFTDRHACLVALYTELSDAVIAATAAAAVPAGGGAGPGEGLGGESFVDVAHRGLGAFVGYLTDDPRRARTLLVESSGVSAQLEQVRHRKQQRYAELILSVWQTTTGTEDTSTRLRLTATGLVGAVNHLLVDWLMTGQTESPQTLTQVSTEMVLAAMTAAAHAP